MIALVNTILTVCGLLLLFIHSIAVLSLIVFVCSFIPVLGVFFSTTPVLMVALNYGGLHVALGALVIVILIHIIEAYFLNPLIYGKQFNLNPVIVLIILLTGYYLFDIWGLLFGVPVAQYFIYQVLAVPVWGKDRLETED